ncbi:hypothetical protein [Kribbella sp. NPDC000426]|uniref:SLAC1 family transporter n=1 Tax=Kribbella sp. NPDC000426 TaxID=3154255 RepID=UPI00332BCF59
MVDAEARPVPAPVVLRGDPAARRVTPSVFAISFGVAGLSLCWSSAGAVGGWALRVSDALWCLTAVVWLLVFSLYARAVTRGKRWRTELLDPVFAPFVPLGAIVPMLLGTALAAHAHVMGLALFGAGCLCTVLLGGWLTGQWVITDANLQQWHPGYFLPTVAGGLVASSCSSSLGLRTLAWAAFGYGLICWLLLGSILLLRLFTQPSLPVPLAPTLAIEVAPPAVAGIAWFGLNGGRTDPVALGLAGYAALNWLAVAEPPYQRLWSLLLLAVVSTAICLLGVRTIRALRAGTFLPRP